MPVINYKNCISCSMCVQACPFSILSLTKKGKQGKYDNLFPEITNDRCIGCGACARSCVMNCITIAEV